MAFKDIRDALEAGKYHCIYEQPNGEAVAEAEDFKLEDKNDMLEILGDMDSLDYSAREGDEYVSFISKDVDGDIRYAVAFEYNFRTGDVTVRVTGDIPDMNEDKEILRDFHRSLRR